MRIRTNEDSIPFCINEGVLSGYHYYLAGYFGDSLDVVRDIKKEVLTKLNLVI